LLLRPHPGWQQRHGHRGDDRKQLPQRGPGHRGGSAHGL